MRWWSVIHFWKPNKSKDDSSKKKDENQNKTCTPLVIDDNPALPPMTKIINKHKNILSLDGELTKVIPKDSIFVSYRSPRNIKDLLISSKLKNYDQHTEHIENGCFKCNKCYLCRHYLQETNTFTSYHTNQVFDIRQNITCNTKNVIYLIECILHQCSNVGYMTNNMKMRFSNNKSHVKKKNATCEICAHLITENHDINFYGTFVSWYIFRNYIWNNNFSRDQGPTFIPSDLQMTPWLAHLLSLV